MAEIIIESPEYFIIELGDDECLECFAYIGETWELFCDDECRDGWHSDNPDYYYCEKEKEWKYINK